jgi:hypothetical protein
MKGAITHERECQIKMRYVILHMVIRKYAKCDRQTGRKKYFSSRRGEI